MFVTNPIGIIGEQEAAKILKKKGFRIIETNWRMGHLEVDLIAENKKDIVFVEVKARTTTFGNKMPEEYVDILKRKRIIAAANAYIKYRQIEKNPRFDIIGITMDPNTYEVKELTHLEDAFLPPQRTIGKSSFSGQGRWKHRGRVIGK